MSTTFDEPPEYDVGDRVVLGKPLGPVWHRRLAVGSTGTVIARTPERLIAVRFDNGVVEHLHPTVLDADRAG